MTQMSESGLMTADELLRLPRGTWRYELVDGALRKMTPAGHVHGRVAAEVGANLTLFVRKQGLGETYAAETGFLLRRGPDTVAQIARLHRGGRQPETFTATAVVMIADVLPGWTVDLADLFR